MRDYLVRQDRLAAYRPSDDPGTLLTDTQIVQYPLVVENATRAMVSMVFAGGQWKLLSVGDASRSRRLVGAVRESARSLQRSESDHFSGRVPALNLEFAGMRDAQNVVLLTPLEDDARWGLKAGIAEPAAKVFARLAPSAKSHDRLPH